MSVIWDELINKGIRKTAIASFLISKGSLNLNAATATKEEIIDALEYACRKGDNSSKRDRLQIVDIESIIETEKRTGIYPISWQSKLSCSYLGSSAESSSLSTEVTLDTYSS